MLVVAFSGEAPQATTHTLAVAEFVPVVLLKFEEQLAKTNRHNDKPMSGITNVRIGKGTRSWSEMLHPFVFLLDGEQ